MIQKPNPILPMQPQNFYHSALLQWSGVLDAVMVKSKYVQAISNRLYLYDCVVNLIRLRGKKIPVCSLPRLCKDRQHCRKKIKSLGLPGPEQKYFLKKIILLPKGELGKL